MYAIPILTTTQSVTAAALCSLVLGSHLCAQTELSFIGRRAFRVEAVPTVVAAGDFNGDGRDDVAVAYWDSNFISILLGRGNGTFQPARELRTDGGIFAVGDFNGDGRQDLAVSAPDGDFHKISILLGERDGTFDAASSFRVRGAPSALGDFNGDRRLDLAMTNQGSDLISILLGRGDGTFRVGRSSVVEGASGSFSVGDFNGDNFADLAVANGEPNTISIFLNKRNGTFRLAGDFAVPGVAGEFTAVGTTVGDFNADGRQDLAVVNHSFDGDTNPGTISIFLSQGDGAFQHASDLGSFPDPFLMIGDFNGDGQQDLAVRDFEFFENDREFGEDHWVTGLSVLLGQGDGTFANGERFGVGRGPGTCPLAVGDFNGDGRQDITTGNGEFPVVSIMLGSGDGTLQDASKVAEAGTTNSVAVADFNTDGRQDLVVDFQNSVSVLLGSGDGTFLDPRNAGVKSGLSRVGDFNGDGRPDLVVFNFEPTVLSVLLGNGNGTFLGAKSLRWEGNLLSIVVADFNADGRQDLAMANFSQFGVQGIVFTLLSKGDGTFQVASRVARRADSMTVGDFNGDGRKDLATANYVSSTVSVFLGNGNGSFQLGRDFRVGGNPQSVAVGDFNADGLQDLVTANFTGDGLVGTVSVLAGKGDGTFQTAKETRVPGNPLSVAVSDFNGDSRQDLATANQDSTISVLLGKGDGTFESPVDFEVLQYSSLAVGDFNGDGLPDLAIPVSWLFSGSGVSISSGVSILINDSALKVDIEIHQEKVNPKSHGIISLAILSTHSFDATSVDATTVRFGANGTEAAPVSVDLRDVDHDGDIDMVLSFEIQQTGIRCGYTAATLQGKALTGQFIRGSDFFETVGCP